MNTENQNPPEEQEGTQQDQNQQAPMTASQGGQFQDDLDAGQDEEDSAGEIPEGQELEFDFWYDQAVESYGPIDRDFAREEYQKGVSLEDFLNSLEEDDKEEGQD